MQRSSNKAGDQSSPCVHSELMSEFFGAHRRGAYVVFRYFDPFVDKAFVVGDFNGWSESVAMAKARDGVWTATVPKSDCPDGVRYKYKVYQGDAVRFISDPYGEKTDGEPYRNSVLCTANGYAWGDGAYIEQRAKTYKNGYDDQPIHVYELDLSDWCSGGDKCVTYESAARELCLYARQMGYTHVLIGDVFSRCYDKDDGERALAFYAPDSRFGDSNGFRRFVDVMHKARVGVIVDWNFDNGRDIYSRHELCLGAVLYWICNYHIDGIALTVSDKRGADIAGSVADGVSAMGCDAAVIVRGSEAARLSGTSHIPVETDRSNSILSRLSDDFNSREISADLQSTATQAISSFGKRRYIDLLPGDEWRKLAAARCAFAALMTSGGKKATYMGCEIGMAQDGYVAWDRLEREYNAGLQLCHSDLGEIYLAHPSLWTGRDSDLVDGSYLQNGVALLERSSSDERLLILVNMSVNAYENTTFKVNACGTYDEIFNSDSQRYNGSGVVNGQPICSERVGIQNVICGVRVPPLAVAIFKLR